MLDIRETKALSTFKDRLFNYFLNKFTGIHQLIGLFLINNSCLTNALFFSICRIVGDNWDLEVKARYQTKFQNNKSSHYFHVKDRVAAQGLDNKRPQNSIGEIKMREFLPTTEVQEAIVADLVNIIPRVLGIISYTLQYIQEGCHLPHPSSTIGNGKCLTSSSKIGSCRNVRGMGKSMVDFRLFEKRRYSNERSTKLDCLPRKEVYT